MSAIRETDNDCSKYSTDAKEVDHVAEICGNRSKASSSISSRVSDTGFDEEEDCNEVTTVVARSDHGNESSDIISDCRSSTLQAIVVSLGDLKKLKYNQSSFPSFELSLAASSSRLITKS